MLRFRIDKTAKGGAWVSKRHCNLNCVWCHHDYFEHSGFRAIDNATLENLVSRVIGVTGARAAHVRIAGDGEPTIVKIDELVDLILRLKTIKQVQAVKMTTNGVLLSGLADDLAHAGLDGATVSLNSVTHEGYRRYAGVDKLDAVLAGIEKARSVGINLNINTVFCSWNEGEIAEFEKVSSSMGGIPIKFFDLLISEPGLQGLYVPLDQLERIILGNSVRIEETTQPYARRTYYLKSGAVFIVKTAGRTNTCPITGCPSRAHCLEGCRHSVRIGLNGVLQPCGVRTDNQVDLLDENCDDRHILNALASGGKIYPRSHNSYPASS